MHTDKQQPQSTVTQTQSHRFDNIGGTGGTLNVEVTESGGFTQFYFDLDDPAIRELVLLDGIKINEVLCNWGIGGLVEARQIASQKESPAKDLMEYACDWLEDRFRPERPREVYTHTHDFNVAGAEGSILIELSRDGEFEDVRIRMRDPHLQKALENNAMCFAFELINCGLDGFEETRANEGALRSDLAPEEARVVREVMNHACDWVEATFGESNNSNGVRQNAK